MSWNYVQNFDSLNNGDLTGQDSWVKSVGLISVQGAVKYAGDKALECNVAPASNNDYTRSITPTAAGSMYFAFRKTSIPTLHASFVFRQNSGTKFAIVFPGLIEGDGVYLEGSGGVMNPISVGLSADTWYVVNVEFDAAGQPNKARARLYSNGSWGGFTAWLPSFANFTQIDSIRLNWGGEGGTSGTIYFDSITGTDPTDGQEEPPPDEEPDAAALQAKINAAIVALHSVINNLSS